jgi:hypothetical protein
MDISHYKIRHKLIRYLSTYYTAVAGFIGIRLRSLCHLYSLDTNLHLESVSKATSEHPFTGLDLNHHSPGTYCTVTTRKCVQEWDVNAG